MKVVIFKGNYDRLQIALSPIRSKWNNGHNKPWTTLIKAGKRDLISGYRLDILGILCIHAGYMFSQQKGVKQILLEFKYGNYLIVNHY